MSLPGTSYHVSKRLADNPRTAKDELLQPNQVGVIVAFQDIGRLRMKPHLYDSGYILGGLDIPGIQMDLP